jgi:hypothetical protein
MVEPRVVIHDEIAPPAAHRRTSLRSLPWAIVVSLSIVLATLVLHRPPRTMADAALESDTVWYLAMVSHHWPPTGAPMDIHAVQAPYRFRVLVPLLASALPFGPVVSLALVTYTALAAAYVFILLTCERLGLSRLHATLGLLIACTFASPMFNFRNPLLTDGFGVLAVAALTYAFLIPSFAMFAVWGLLAIFGRETIALVLPAWIVRDLRRCLALLAIAAVLLVAERMILWAYVPDATKLLTILWLDIVQRVRYPQRFVADLVVSWGWAFGFLALGFLLRARELKPVIPAAVAALACAFITSILATDVERYFSMLLPAMTIAFAVIVREWMSTRNRVMLTLLAGLAVLQVFVSWPNTFVKESTWMTTWARVPMAKIGALWIAIAFVALWKPLQAAFTELMTAARKRPPYALGGAWSRRRTPS